MRLYNVYFYLLNGESFILHFLSENYLITSKVENFLKDNGGGTAEVFGESFYTTVEA